MNFTNATRHTVVLDLGAGRTVAFVPEGEPIRLPSQQRGSMILPYHPAEGPPVDIPVIDLEDSDSDVDDVAAEIVSRYYDREAAMVIVSGRVLDALDRRDHSHALTVSLAPDTGPGSAIRNSDGNIVAVRRFRHRPGRSD